MPSRKVKDSERRRCARACDNCKRRKERCDGLRPCRRCVQRGVESRCHFKTTVDGPGIPQHPSRSPVRRLDQHGTTAHHPSSPPSSDQGLSDRRGPHGGHDSIISLTDASTTLVANDSFDTSSREGIMVLPASSDSPPTPVPQVSRLLSDGRGKLMFLGDTANLSFLQIIRRLVHDCLGPCSFVDDPLRHHLVEAAPGRQTNWLPGVLANPPPKPDLDSATYLLGWFKITTNPILNLFDNSDLTDQLSEWILSTDDSDHGGRSDEESDVTSCIFYLVLAIGAQTCDRDRDEIADKYFSWGRLLATSGMAEEPSIVTVRTYVLITTYLLGASRRNSAYMALGTAVRAAYALGMHRNDVGPSFSAEDVRLRSRVWTAVRILDIFMSVSLGRPPATNDSSDIPPTSPSETSQYSSANDLCGIFGSILTDVYAKRKLIPQDLERISERHRRWSANLSSGLTTDNIPPDEYIESPEDRTRHFNMGLCYLKQSYYCSVMLLSRPFLIQTVAKHISRLRATADSTKYDGPEPTKESSSASRDQILVDACVDSAIRTVDLLQGFMAEAKTTPKRLPFLVNAAFVSALVLGLAFFCDLEDSFPLNSRLQWVVKILRKFGAHDAVAKRNSVIVESLHEACGLYREQRAHRKMERRRYLVGSLFGSVHDPTRDKAYPLQSAPSSGRQTRQSTTIPSDGNEAIEGRVNSYNQGNNGSNNNDSHPAFYAEDMGSDGDGMGVVPNFAPLGADGLLLPMSPRALFLDSFEEFVPLYPTVDARYVHMQDQGRVDGDGTSDAMMMGGMI